MKQIILGGSIYTVLDGEFDVRVKIAQFGRPEVENRGSRLLIVGFLMVGRHRRFYIGFYRFYIGLYKFYTGFYKFYMVFIGFI